MFFSDEQINELRKGYAGLEGKYRGLRDTYAFRQYKNAKAAEYATHGFLRRIQTIKRCIENVFLLCPPERTKKLSTNELSDLAINLQGFIFNLFGCIDNLAWIWVSEKNILGKKGKPLPVLEIGFSKKQTIVRNSLSAEFRAYLTELDEWFNYLENYRHALAHRIPPYVPPFLISKKEAKESEVLEQQKTEALRAHKFEEYDRLNAEQETLGKYAPVMGHSFFENESRQIVFHFQIITDWITVCQMAERFLGELDNS